MVPALTAMSITIVVAAVVGIRLIRLSRRTGEIPEACAGVGLLTFAVAQICALVMAGAHGSLSPGMSDLLRILTLAAFTVVSIGLALFTVFTFGLSTWRWALAATAILAGILFRIAIFAKEAAGVVEGAEHETLQGLAALTIAFIFLWMGVEGITYHRKAVRARALGLASAAVVNRFLVFGVGGLASGLMTVGVAASGLLGSMEAVGIPLILGAGLVNCVVWTLSFAPPAAYRRFIEERAARREASHA